MQSLEELVNESTTGALLAVVVNISYFPYVNNKKTNLSDLPEYFVLDIPSRIREHEGKPDYEDLVESFVYNTLSKKFQTEVASCQIWIS